MTDSGHDDQGPAEVLIGRGPPPRDDRGPVQSYAWSGVPEHRQLEGRVRPLDCEWAALATPGAGLNREQERRFWEGFTAPKLIACFTDSMAQYDYAVQRSRFVSKFYMLAVHLGGGSKGDAQACCVLLEMIRDYVAHARAEGIQIAGWTHVMCSIESNAAPTVGSVLTEMDAVFVSPDNRTMHDEHTEAVEQTLATGVPSAWLAPGMNRLRFLRGVATPESAVWAEWRLEVETGVRDMVVEHPDLYLFEVALSAAGFQNAAMTEWRERFIALEAGDKFRAAQLCSPDDAMRDAATCTADDATRDAMTRAADDATRDAMTRAADDAVREVATCTADDAVREVATCAADDTVRDAVTCAADDAARDAARHVMNDAADDAASNDYDDNACDSASGLTGAAGEDAGGAAAGSYTARDVTSSTTDVCERRAQQLAGKFKIRWSALGALCGQRCGHWQRLASVGAVGCGRRMYALQCVLARRLCIGCGGNAARHLS